ncbi:acetoacetate decarboxylase family protein [Streptomyces radiopugnans]|nr:acetoacetate decarboxylase family protein [Streptomyces radiopugnans]
MAGRSRGACRIPPPPRTGRSRRTRLPPGASGGICGRRSCRCATGCPSRRTSARWRAPPLLAVGLVRYREGTLVYDELAMGPLVRRGRRAGLLIDRIWVSDTASVRGGRDIWGLPKELASFTWSDGSVHVTDHDGPVAGLAFAPGRLRLPAFPLPLPGFSGSAGRRLFVPGRLVGSLRPETVAVTSWSDRLPPLERTTARLSVAVRPFRMTVPEPVRC